MLCKNLPKMTHELQELFDKDGKHISPQLGEDAESFTGKVITVIYGP